MIRALIEKHLTPMDEFIFGFADLRGLLHPEFSNYLFAISIGKKLNDSILDKLVDGPTLEYYKHYNDINKDLVRLTQRIQTDLRNNNISSMPIRPTISTGSGNYRRYLNKLTYDISHKMVAKRAGLGWIGKTALLISAKFGPRLRLVTILLNRHPGTTTVPIDKSKCGKCNICVEKCPAQAANGIL